jgi:hypothetical protein
MRPTPKKSPEFPCFGPLFGETQKFHPRTASNSPSTKEKIYNGRFWWFGLEYNDILPYGTQQKLKSPFLPFLHSPSPIAKTSLSWWLDTFNFLGAIPISSKTGLNETLMLVDCQDFKFIVLIVFWCEGDDYFCLLMKCELMHESQMQNGSLKSL